MNETPVGLRSCPHCGAQMPETAAFCPGCGRSMQTTAHPGARVGVFPETIAGALAYLTFLPAILFLAMDPYRKNRFVRFHSIQCLLVWVTAVLLALLIKLVGVVLFMIPVLGPLFVLLIDVVAILAAIFIWLVLVIKALQGEIFKLSLLGELAEQRAGLA